MSRAETSTSGRISRQSTKFRLYRFAMAVSPRPRCDRWSPARRLGPQPGDIGDDIVDIAPAERHGGHFRVRRRQPGPKMLGALLWIGGNGLEWRCGVAAAAPGRDDVATGTPLLGELAADRCVPGCRLGCGRQHCGQGKGDAPREPGGRAMAPATGVCTCCCHEPDTASSSTGRGVRTMRRWLRSDIDVAQRRSPGRRSANSAGNDPKGGRRATTAGRSGAGRPGDVRRLPT